MLDSETATIVLERFFRCIIYKKILLINSKNIIINYKIIDVFNKSSRSKNDVNNKIREHIIGEIINKNLPNDYFKYFPKWNNLKKAIYKYIKDLCILNNINEINTLKCVPKGGRKYNYDLTLEINGIELKIEFKYNARCVNDTPQFASPMKPSQYLSYSFERYYYNNYFPKIIETYKALFPDEEVDTPSEEAYMKEIHQTNPPCLSNIQAKYYDGVKKKGNLCKNFEKICKEVSKQGIQNFISNNGLNTDKLTEYLLKTQKKKFYMLYKDGDIKLETINLDDYVIINYLKDIKYQRYIATTKSGIKMKILLRWKNGNGIAFPAFQIKACK